MSRLARLTSLFALPLLAAASAHAQWSTHSIAQPRGTMAAATVGDLAFFAGGNSGSNIYDTVDIYDASTDSWSSTALPTPRTQVAAAAVGDLVFFAGGAGIGGVPFSTVDVYDDSTGLWSLGASLSAARVMGPQASAVVGTRAFFGGGHFSQAGELIPSRTRCCARTTSSNRTSVPSTGRLCGSKLLMERNTLCGSVRQNCSLANCSWYGRQRAQ